METLDTLVVGAGVTGLSCARRLSMAGRRVLILEAADRVGGVVRSESVTGVGTIDLGPQTLRSGDGELLADIAALGLEGDRLVAGANGSARYLYRDGELVPLPHGPGEFLHSRVLPTAAKLRILAEPFRRRRAGADESVESFFAHRLGDAVASRLVDPFVSGVYAGDPERLSMRAVFPELKAGVDRSGSLLSWALGRFRAARRADEKRAGARRRPELFSFRGGLGQWTCAMAESLGEGAVRTGETVTRVLPAGPGWEVRTARGEAFRTRDVVLAVPAGVAGRLCGADFAAPRRSLEDIPYAPVATVHLAYRREQIRHPLDGFGFLCPSDQARPVLGVLWISSLFPERVEEGTVLTTTFIGGARQASNARLPEHRLIRIAHREHARVLGAVGRPRMARVRLWDPAIPQYELGHLERVGAADEIEEAAPGLHLAGAWRGGVSVPDCWTNGRRLAERILAGPAADSHRPRRRARRTQLQSPG